MIRLLLEPEAARTPVSGYFSVHHVPARKTSERKPCVVFGHGDAHTHEGGGACTTHRDHPVPDSQCAVSVCRTPFCDARDVDSLKKQNKKTDELLSNAPNKRANYGEVLRLFVQKKK